MDVIYYVSVCVVVQVRVNSLVCLGKILEYLDKWYVIDEVLPFLQQIPSREPAVLMGMLGNQSPSPPQDELILAEQHLTCSLSSLL